MQIDSHLLKRVPLRTLNPEVNFRFYGRSWKIDIA